MEEGFITSVIDISAANPTISSVVSPKEEVKTFIVKEDEVVEDLSRRNESVDKSSAPTEDVKKDLVAASTRFVISSDQGKDEQPEEKKLKLDSPSPSNKKNNIRSTAEKPLSKSQKNKIRYRKNRLRKLMSVNIDDVPLVTAINQALQVQASPPIQVTPQSPTASNIIPILNNSHVISILGRMESDYTVVDHPVQIANQDSLSGATYDQMQAICSTDMNLTRNDFIRMWKTLILKRVQDVYEIEKHLRPAHFIAISRTIMVPAPLGDLLANLGMFHSSATGHFHHITPPAYPAEPDDWWVVDNDLVARWSHTMARMQYRYRMKEFPSNREVDNRPMILIRRSPIQNGFLLLKANTNEPRLVDGVISAVNDELFDDVACFTFDNAALNVSSSFQVAPVRGTYIGSYVLD
ncbi:CLUMA_CG018826, isoform A [Clunio marinus]|uniref:CLUMA_CG018826, isoform A n=1 Tax=Clunio marinus TaxID=568069 RepID=A0A1J1J2W6_9DIPT|nr:CLUMA_CG018826, isoform A [Clunio marinus]